MSGVSHTPLRIVYTSVFSKIYILNAIKRLARAKKTRPKQIKVKSKSVLKHSLRTNRQAHTTLCSIQKNNIRCK